MPQAATQHGNNPHQRKQDGACDDHADAVSLVFLNIQRKKTSQYSKRRDAASLCGCKGGLTFLCVAICCLMATF